MTIKFPYWAAVTPCKTQTQSFVEWSQHGAARREFAAQVAPFLIGITSTGRAFPAVVSIAVPDKYIAAPCGGNCPNAAWARANG